MTDRPTLLSAEPELIGIFRLQVTFYTKLYVIELKCEVSVVYVITLWSVIVCLEFFITVVCILFILSTSDSILNQRTT